MEFEASKKRVRFDGEEEQASSVVQSDLKSAGGGKVVEVGPASRSNMISDSMNPSVEAASEAKEKHQDLQEAEGAE